LAEARAGAQRSAAPERWIAAWDFLLEPFTERILPFDKDAADAYGDIRAQLEQRGDRIGDRACMIAAIARCHGLTVVTTNQSERVPACAGTRGGGLASTVKSTVRQGGL